MLGGLSFLLPGITALVLLYFIAARTLIIGVIEIIYAIALQRENRNEWLYILKGVLSVMFGGILFVFPGVGALALVTVIGAYAVVIGILLLVVAFRLRKLKE